MSPRLFSVCVHPQGSPRCDFYFLSITLLDVHHDEGWCLPRTHCYFPTTTKARPASFLPFFHNDKKSSKAGSHPTLQRGLVTICLPSLRIPLSWGGHVLVPSSSVSVLAFSSLAIATSHESLSTLEGHHCHFPHHEIPG